ncbi:kinase-like protein [Hymenopellis radicata]|nr:kinase-like protein [Hymenopellis radicata]
MLLVRSWRRFSAKISRALARFIRSVWRASLGTYIFIKRSRFLDVEVASMNFVRRRTTIPIPRVLAVIPYRKHRYIFMTRLAGAEIGHESVWESFPQSKRDAILAQMRNIVRQLRAIGPPPRSPPLICSVLGGPVMDYRLCAEPSGPYRDEEEMNAQVRLGMSAEDIAQLRGIPARFVDDIKKAHARRHPIVFTHNDIALRNIMVDGDRVTGLIDWECAGWFPAHWEYVKTCWGDYFPERAFARDIGRFVPRYEFENWVDNVVGWGREEWDPELERGFEAFRGEAW